MHDGVDIGEVLKVVVFGGIALFSFVAKLLKDKKRPQAPAAQSEEARRVREEIRRKIAERQGGRPSSAPSAPPVVRRAPVSQTQAPRPVFSGQNTLQEVLRERLRRREAEEQRLADLRQAAMEEMTPPEPVVIPVQAQVQPLLRRSDRVLGEIQPSSAPLDAGTLAGEFTDTDALRRALVMNEILSAPLALRRSRLTAW